MYLCNHDIDRFWAKVQKTGNCWIWMGALKPNGYGQMGFQIKGKPVPRLVHRISYVIHYGNIPPGMFVCHTCDNPPCVRPDHLFLGTAADNTADMIAKGRQYIQPTTKAKREYVRVWLTEEQVEEIRILRSSGLTLKNIADRFSVSESAISLIVRHKRH